MNITTADLNLYGFQPAYIDAVLPLWLQEADDEDSDANREKLRQDIAEQAQKDIEEARKNTEMDLEVPDVSDDIPNPTGAGKM